MRRCSESVCQHLARHPAVHKEPASGSGPAEIIKKKLVIVGALRVPQEGGASLRAPLQRLVQALYKAVGSYPELDYSIHDRNCAFCPEASKEPELATIKTWGHRQHARPPATTRGVHATPASCAGSRAGRRECARRYVSLHARGCLDTLR